MIAVYTALFGPYDNLQEPYYRSHLDGADFILFTDTQYNLNGWQEKLVAKLPHPDPRYASRYFFDNSTRILPEYEYTIMHGANARLTMPPEKVIEYLVSYPGNADMACFRHPHRVCVYGEAQEVIRLRKDNAEVVNAQMERYRQDGFPENYGLSACILLVRRNTPKLKEFEALWWSEVEKGSCRDQLSFDYCRWKLGVEVAYLPGSPFGSPILKIGRHKK